MTATLTSVNISAGIRAPWATGMGGRTGINKQPVTDRVRVHTLGLAGDFIGDLSRHGGPHQAVYAYAREDAEWWARELGRPIPPGGFGENLSTTGLDVTGAVIGERWRIGSTLLEVCLPRIPCSTFAGFWDIPDLPLRFIRRATPGAYLRVIEEGELGAGDPIEVTDRPGHGVTIGEALRAITMEPQLLPRLLLAPALPDWVRERVARRVGGMR